MKSIVKNIYEISYILLIFSSIVFVTGTFYGIPYKILLTIVAFTFFIMVQYYKDYNSISFNNNFSMLLTLFIIFIISFIVGIINGFEAHIVIEELQQSLTPLIILSLYNEKIIKKEKLLKIILIASLIYSFIKIYLVYLISLNFLTSHSIVSFIERAFSYDIMTQPIDRSRNIVRLYSINDLIVALSPLILFDEKNKFIKSQYIRAIFFIIFSLAIYLSYSRYIIFVFALSSFIAWLSNNKSNALLFKKNIAYLFSVILLLLIFGIPEPLKERFNPSNYRNITSDKNRIEQINSILEMVEDHYLVGAGLGSYNFKNIRQKKKKYSYELQLLSFMFKFGVFMYLIIIFCIIAFYFYNYEINFKSAIIYLILFLGCLFNPMIQSSIFGIAILITKLLYHKTKETDKNIGYSKSINFHSMVKNYV